MPLVLSASLPDSRILLPPEPSGREILRLGWPALEQALPDGGLPRGSVVELQAPHVLGGGTFLALAAVRAVHHERPEGWCAWVDPEGSLFAPALAASGLDLHRLLLLRPPRTALARTTLKALLAGVFDVLVVDMAPVLGTAVAAHEAPAAPWRLGPAPEVFVRQLALRAAETGTSVLLLTDAHCPRALPWPVALRLELSRTPHALELRIAKERFGRVGSSHRIPWSG